MKKGQEQQQPALPKDFFKQFKNKEEFQSFFNDLFRRGVEEMLQAELDEHLDYEKYAKRLFELIEVSEDTAEGTDVEECFCMFWFSFEVSA